MLQILDFADSSASLILIFKTAWHLRIDVVSNFSSTASHPSYFFKLDKFSAVIPSQRPEPNYFNERESESGEVRSESGECGVRVGSESGE